MSQQAEYFLHFVQQVAVTLLLAVAAYYVLLAGWPQFAAPPETQSALPATAVPVSGDLDGLFGNVRIASTEGWSLSRVRVLVNGEQTADLANGSLLLRVRPGDVVELDCSAYSRQLDFTVQAISASIDSAYLSEQVSAQGAIARCGVIVFR